MSKTLAAPGAYASKHQRRLSRQVAADVVAISDVFSVVLGGLLPALIYAVIGDFTIDQLTILQATMLAGFIAHLCLRFRGMYDTSRMDAFPFKPVELLIAICCGMIGVLGIGLPLNLQHVDLVLWYTAWLSASFLVMLITRLTTRSLIASLAAAGRFNERVAIFGAGPIARRVYDIVAEPRLGITFAGLYDDRMGTDRINPEGLAVHGRLDDLIKSAREGAVDRIVIALPQSANDRMAAIVGHFDSLPISTHVVTHIASDLLETNAGFNVSSIGPIGLLDVKKKTLNGRARASKRAEDIILGCVLLAISAPLWPLIAIAIKLDSAGPVLFAQKRRGRYQSTINVLKFRTMRVMENGPLVQQAVVKDPRVTRVGRILRRASLDELPQLINVIRGEMSLIGPRPHALAHDDEFSRLLHLYPDRHQMRPGMTGLAQVSGFRGSTAKPGSIEARVKADLAYVRAWSIWLDIKILSRTFAAVISGTNAD